MIVVFFSQLYQIITHDNMVLSIKNSTHKILEENKLHTWMFHKC